MEQKAQLESDLEKKTKDADEVKTLRAESERLREQVLEFQRENSAQQAKILMGALGNNSGAPSAFGALLGGSLAGPQPSSTSDSNAKEERTA